MYEDRIADLELLLGHAFRDKNLLINALSHSSIKSERMPSNERMEFLGDSVLGLLVSEALYRRLPDEDEGTLTRIKSHAVSRATLQRVATAMGLDRYILVGKGVLKREIPASLLGNLFEAIVGAIYLDTGLSASRRFVLRHLDVVIEEILDDRAERNYKSMLQHYCQKERGAVPVYRVHNEGGPAHNRHFEVGVFVDNREQGRARAGSKKEAEQGAARAALIGYGVLDESPKQEVRGAGTVLSVGEGGGGRKRRRRGRRGGAATAEAPAPPAPAQETPKEPSRRRRGRRGRGRGASGAEGESTAPPEEASQNDGAAPADGKSSAGAAKPRRRRRRGGRGRASGSAPSRASLE